MKQIKLVLSLVISVVAFNLHAQDVANAKTEITFKKMVHDFGNINEGDVVETTFEYTNTGTAPLYVTKIKASCGCTIPSNWSKEPLKPGDTGFFTVKFNSRNKPNRQSKRISILANTAKGNEYVTIKAQVKPDPKMEAIRAERLAKRKAQYEKDKKAKEAIKKGQTVTPGSKKPKTSLK